MTCHVCNVSLGNKVPWCESVHDAWPAGVVILTREPRLRSRGGGLYKTQHPESPAGRSKACGLFMGVAPGLRSEMPLLLARPASRGSRQFSLARGNAALFGLELGLDYLVVVVIFEFFVLGRGGREALHEDFRNAATVFRLFLVVSFA
mgnify:CR=1 FL=1